MPPSLSRIDGLIDVLLRFLDRILNPRLLRRFIWALFLLGGSLIGYNSLVSFASEIEWRYADLFLKIKASAQTETWLQIVGVLFVLIACYFVYASHVSQRRDGNKEKTEHKGVKTFNVRPTDVGLLQDSNGLHTYFTVYLRNASSSELHINSLRFTTLKRWDFPFSKKMFALSSWTPKPVEPNLEIRPNINDVSENPVIISLPGRKGKAISTNLYTKYVIEENGLVYWGTSVFLLKVDAVLEKGIVPICKIIVRLAGTFASTEPSKGIGITDYRNQIAKAKEICRIANESAEIEYSLLQNMNEIATYPLR